MLDYLVKVVVFVDMFWLYGICVYLSVCFSVFVELGGLFIVDLFDFGV